MGISDGITDNGLRGTGRIGTAGASKCRCVVVVCTIVLDARLGTIG